MGRGWAWFEVFRADIVCGARRLLAAGSAETDGAAAALGPKVRSGIHFLPNPLVGNAATGVWEGVGLGLRCLEWILLHLWLDKYTLFASLL